MAPGWLSPVLALAITARGGRPGVSEEIRAIIRRMASENADWGAPKIHSELLKPGFDVSQTDRRQVSSTAAVGPQRSCQTLARVSCQSSGGRRPMDFFTVPTLTFRVLYCLFVIGHERRRILHFNVMPHPTSDWIVQQLREAFPGAGQYRYALLDHDTKFDGEVIAFLKATGLTPKRTGVRAPWQNGIAERWVGSCRREISDHVIPLNERHLRRLVRDYVNYHHHDRLHDSLEKDTPGRRPVELKPSPVAMVTSSARLGALHHRYGWSEAEAA
jgi:transposase InsO family protein